MFCLNVYVCLMEFSAYSGHKSVSVPTETGVQVIVSQHVCAGEQTQAVYNSSKVLYHWAISVVLSNASLQQKEYSYITTNWIFYVRNINCV